MDSDHQADKAWLLSAQRKLYQWSRQHPDESYRELWNWVIDPRNLRCAWARVATNQGKRTAGIDGKTVGSIRRDIGEHAYLDELRSALRCGAYAPSPCRRKLIPKPGKPGQFRALGIPTVANYPTSPWFLESRMHSERCTSGSARGHAKLPVARSARRACPTQPYIATDEGWLFLAVVIDLFNRQVVGWALRPDMTREIVIDALRMAWFKRHPSKQAGLIFHSDRGSQYASQDFRDVLKEYGITSSMSRRGNCWDNACSETLFGSLKVERLHGQRFETRRHAMDETIAWLLWYNSTRLHSTLAYVSPMRFEQDWFAAQPKQVNS